MDGGTELTQNHLEGLLQRKDLWLPSIQHISMDGGTELISVSVSLQNMHVLSSL